MAKLSTLYIATVWTIVATAQHGAPPFLPRKPRLKVGDRITCAAAAGCPYKGEVRPASSGPHGPSCR
jgi:hypothetical protein